MPATDAERASYFGPTVTDKGRLVDLTSELDLSLVGVATKIVSFAAVSGPIVGSSLPSTTNPTVLLPSSTPGGSGATDPSVVTSPSPTGTGGNGGTLNTTGSGSDPTGSGGTLGGSGSGGTSGTGSGAGSASGRLPFTGFAVMLVAGVGAATAGAGAAVRAKLRRAHS